MSQENVDLGWQALDAFNRRDLGAYLELVDADVEFAWIPMEADYRGHAGIRRFLEKLFEAFPDLAIEDAEVRDLGDLTLAVAHARGHGAGSDTRFDETVRGVTEWRDGKIVWFGGYGTEAEALEAVGLSE